MPTTVDRTIPDANGDDRLEIGRGDARGDNEDRNTQLLIGFP